MEPGDVRQEHRGRQGDHPVGGAQHVGETGLEGAVVETVGVGQQLVERRAVGVGAEALAVGAGAEEEVEDPLGAPARRERVSITRASPIP